MNNEFHERDTNPGGVGGRSALQVQTSGLGKIFNVDGGTHEDLGRSSSSTVDVLKDCVSVGLKHNYTSKHEQEAKGRD